MIFLDDLFIQRIKKLQAVERAQLKNTRIIAQMYRDAKNIPSPSELINELWMLLLASAKYEWGENTEVDDFSVPEKIVIKKGRMEAII